MMATQCHVWIKQGEGKDSTRIFKTFRMNQGIWNVRFGSGIFPAGFTQCWSAGELALQSERSVSRGDHQAEAIREMYAKWQKRVEKEGFTFKGSVTY